MRKMMKILLCEVYIDLLVCPKLVEGATFQILKRGRKVCKVLRVVALLFFLERSITTSGSIVVPL